MSKLFKKMPSDDEVKMNYKKMIKKISKKIIDFSAFERLCLFNQDFRDFYAHLFINMTSPSDTYCVDEITIEIDEDDEEDEDGDYNEVQDEEPYEETFRKFEEEYNKHKEEEETKEDNTYNMYRYFVQYNIRQIKKLKTMELFWLYYTITKKFKKMNLVDEEDGQEWQCTGFYFNFKNEICFVHPR